MAAPKENAAELTSDQQAGYISMVTALFQLSSDGARIQLLERLLADASPLVVKQFMISSLLHMGTVMAPRGLAHVVPSDPRGATGARSHHWLQAHRWATMSFGWLGRSCKICYSNWRLR